MRLEFFFDLSSPWTYLAFERVQPLAAELGATIEWRPILVGGIFNQVNPGVEWFKSLDKTPPRKTAYSLKDMADWARATNITIKFPPTGHPVNSVKVMRGCIAIQREHPDPADKLIPFARACFEAYFRDDRLTSDDAVITSICQQTGVDPAWLFATDRHPGDEGRAPGEHRRGHRPQRLRLADDVPRRDGHVLRRRPAAARSRRAGA